jgi:hypothetical protein
VFSDTYIAFFENQIAKSPPGDSDPPKLLLITAVITRSNSLVPVVCHTTSADFAELRRPPEFLTTPRRLLNFPKLSP